MPNKLINETSPYLLQHAHNPVNWYPWGEEALNRARAENKPIFLSIGYAACHWCHVMAHESFEDSAIAALLNDHFIPIKVDREERPDLDSIYMNAVVSMTGQGGWPMSVFLTPQGEPFYGGTYFPPTRRYGMPSFREILEAVNRAWNEDNAKIRQAGQELTQSLQANNLTAAQSDLLRPEVLQQATENLLKTYDWAQGGWGRAPRFPQPMVIEFLLMQATRAVVQTQKAAEHALEQMSRGGMYDVVGGGFHRYSTDDAWLVPHFEKMLYDNGQLALVYLHAFLLSGQVWFRQVCTETLDFILREMRHPEGGFFSSLDADSEGQEGKYYLWSLDEITSVLSDPSDRDLLGKVYNLPEAGNFEGRIILQRSSDLSLLAQELGMDEAELIERQGTIHQQLYAAREKRIRPQTDDKVLVSWNALALRAFAQAARTLHRADYLQAAQQNADFLLRAMYTQGRLLRAWRNGQAHHNAYLEDYAGLILALLDLYQADNNLRWYQAALQLMGDMQDHFRDPQGGFFDTRSDHGELITRPKELQDNATPSGNALAVSALLHLAAYDERADWRAQAEGMLGSLQDYMIQHPTAFAFWLQGFDFAIGPVRQIALICPTSKNEDQAQAVQAMLYELSSTYRPRTVTAVSFGEAGPESPALLHERILQQNRPTAYVCENFTCKLPVNSLEGLQKQLQTM